MNKYASTCLIVPSMYINVYINIPVIMPIKTSLKPQNQRTCIQNVYPGCHLYISCLKINQYASLCFSKIYIIMLRNQYSACHSKPHFASINIHVYIIVPKNNQQIIIWFCLYKNIHNHASKSIKMPKFARYPQSCLEINQYASLCLQNMAMPP